MKVQDVKSLRSTDIVSKSGAIHMNMDDRPVSLGFEFCLAVRYNRCGNMFALSVREC